METITVYRNPGLQLTHFAGEDEERTFCKHYRLNRMDKIEHNKDYAALWCTDCIMGITRREQSSAAETLKVEPTSTTRKERDES